MSAVPSDTQSNTKLECTICDTTFSCVDILEGKLNNLSCCGQILCTGCTVRTTKETPTGKIFSCPYCRGTFTFNALKQQPSMVVINDLADKIKTQSNSKTLWNQIIDLKARLENIRKKKAAKLKEYELLKSKATEEIEQKSDKEIEQLKILHEINVNKKKESIKQLAENKAKNIALKKKLDAIQEELLSRLENESVEDALSKEAKRLAALNSALKERKKSLLPTTTPAYDKSKKPRVAPATEPTAVAAAATTAVTAAGTNGGALDSSNPKEKTSGKQLCSNRNELRNCCKVIISELINHGLTDTALQNGLMLVFEIPESVGVNLGATLQQRLNSDAKILAALNNPEHTIIVENRAKHQALLIYSARKDIKNPMPPNLERTDYYYFRSQHLGTIYCDRRRLQKDRDISEIIEEDDLLPKLNGTQVSLQSAATTAPKAQ